MFLIDVGFVCLGNLAANFEVLAMDYSLVSIFILLVLLLLSLSFLLKHKISKKLPPGPPKLPIIGNLHQVGVLPHVSFWQLSKKYGPVMLLHLGCVPTVIISSAEAAKEVLKTHDVYTCSRPPLAGTGRLSYDYRDIAFTPYGDYYKEMRKIFVVELFTHKRVQSFRFIREEEVALMIDEINKASASLTTVDLNEKMMTLTADITCREAFGKSFRERGISSRSFQDVIHEAFAMLGSFSAADFFPYVGWIIDRFTGLHARREQSFHELDLFYQEVIDDHIQAEKTKSENEHGDIVDVLLKLTRIQTESNAYQITQDHIKALLMDIFLAGVDTGEVTLVWAMAELMRKPAVMRKVQDEIRTFVGAKRIVTEDDLDHFHYLKMVLKETLRLHPPATLLLPRETTSEINLSGYHIRPKTRMQVNIWAIARDSKTWKDPLEFVPERFIDNPIDFRGQNYELLPFGAGRRICPGISLGVVTVQLALANLLYCFDWKLPDGMKVEDIDMGEVSGLSTYKKTPIRLIPVKYRPASAK